MKQLRLWGTMGMMVMGMTVVGLGACGNDVQQQADVQRGPATETYAPELGVDLQQMNRTETGLYIQDIEQGAGAVAQPGNNVRVHYTGWLPDGSEFDSSRGGEPFEFTLGQGMVISGWDEGVDGMREGGQRRLVIPYHLAYGERGAGGVIPPYATLIFDVELLHVQ
jgi:FKBP-type peptidyl-prolyl cis-trans isomerase FkpA